MYRAGIKGLIGGAALVCSLLATGALLPRAASAEFDICRTDPVIQLSNGGSMIVNTETATSPSNVSQIDIVLHLPTGVYFTGFRDTGPSQVFESVSLGKASRNGSYSADVTVHSSARGAAVTANEKYQGGSDTETGTTNKAISLTVS